MSKTLLLKWEMKINVFNTDTLKSIQCELFCQFQFFVISVTSAGNIPILLSVNFNGHVNILGLNSNCRACGILGDTT